MSKPIDCMKDIFDWSYKYNYDLYQARTPNKKIPPLLLTNEEKTLLVERIAECMKNYLSDDNLNLENEVRQKYPDMSDVEVKSMASIYNVLRSIFYDAIGISIYEGKYFVTLQEIASILDILFLEGIDDEDIRTLSKSLVGYASDNLTPPCDPKYNQNAYEDYKYTVEVLRKLYNSDEHFYAPFYFISNKEMQIISTVLMDFVVAHQEIDYNITEENVIENKKYNPDFTEEECKYNLQYDFLLRLIFANAINYSNLENKNITVREIMNYGFDALRELHIPDRLIAEIQSEIIAKLKVDDYDCKMSINRIDIAQRPIVGKTNKSTFAFYRKGNFGGYLFFYGQPNEVEDLSEEIDDFYDFARPKRNNHVS